VANLTVAEQTGDVAVIDKGLDAGDKVVTSNQYRLQPGARVRANDAPAQAAP
jgi:multidrug efflux system membrane fusion protein